MLRASEGRSQIGSTIGCAVLRDGSKRERKKGD